MVKQLSKAKTLESLKAKVNIFQIPDLLVFECNSYHERTSEILDEIKRKFNGKPLIVRSSAYDEDDVNNSFAGEYDSVLNVSSTDRAEIVNAITTVISSYTTKGGARTGKDEVIVQEMVLNTSMSGVVFTHDLNTGAPYYVINYDDVSGLTDTVTSGGSEYANRTLYVHRNALHSIRSERFDSLLKAIQELETVMNNKFLDIEFALSSDYRPYLLQVRSITTQPNWNRAVSRRVDKTLAGIQRLVKQRLKPMDGVFGETTVLGQMPDWNPAEMIGRAPRALAFSLYQKLITDNAWRIARRKMGYAIPSGKPLMLSLAGQPFIDVRLCFHSYLPEGLAPSSCLKLVDHWVERLKRFPELHDKVEFDVAITTYSFDIDEKMDRLIGDTLDIDERKEFKTLLRAQTNEFLSNTGEYGIDDAMSKIETLTDKQTQWNSLSVNKDVFSIFNMIESCIQLGTTPFAMLARHGFIAKTILMSLGTKGIITEHDIEQLQSSVHTVASDLVQAMHSLQKGKMSYQDFMLQYGHLRPGTYDILSQRYDQMPELERQGQQKVPAHETIDYVLSESQLSRIDSLLVEEGFKNINSDMLLGYIQKATSAREYAKFVFTKTVSDIIELIANFGEENNLSRDELSHVPLDNILAVLSASHENSIEESLRVISEAEAEKHAISVAIRLPHILFDEAGVHIVPFQISHPNFITHKKITASCIKLGADSGVVDLKGKIVIIENADPGFDWIFSQEISGLITKYGGANSHMAIRCAEFGIPAAIGCGEQRYELFCRTNQLLLDCAAGFIQPLH